MARLLIISMLSYAGNALSQSNAIDSVGQSDEYVTSKDSLKFYKKEQRKQKRKDNVKNKAKTTKEAASNKIGGAKDSLSSELSGAKDSLKAKLNSDTLKNKLKEKGNELLTAEKNYVNQKKDSALNYLKTKYSLSKENILKKTIKSLNPHGTISAGYEYGVLPFVYGGNFPTGGFRSEGNISLSVLKVPLELNYYYTNVKNVIGLNNYFRISYDANKYKEQLKNTLGDQRQVLQNEIGGLKRQQQQLAKQIAFAQYMEKYPDYSMPVNKPEVPTSIPGNATAGLSSSVPTGLSSQPALPGQSDLTAPSGMSNMQLPGASLPASPSLNQPELPSVNQNAIQLPSSSSLIPEKGSAPSLPDIKAPALNTPSLPLNKIDSLKTTKDSLTSASEKLSSKVSAVQENKNEFSAGHDSIEKININSDIHLNDSLAKTSSSIIPDSTKTNQAFSKADSTQSRLNDSLQLKKEKLNSKLNNYNSKKDSVSGNVNDKLASGKEKAEEGMSYKTKSESFVTEYSSPPSTEKLSAMGRDALSANQNDTTAKARERKEKRDSISRQLGKYVAKYDSVNTKINEIRAKIEEMKDYEHYGEKMANPYITKAQQFLSCVKKFELGLCHPTSSMFLLNNIPLQGINIELEKNSKFVSLAYGTTINNFQFNPYTIDGLVQGTRNYYNYFDFGNIEAGRKVILLKGGIGSKESTHLFVGALIGKGKTDYVYILPDPGAAEKESNLVLEIDGKYNFNSHLSTELIFGKSSLQQEDLSTTQLKRCVNEIFSNYRSNALLSRTTFSITKSKTNLTGTVRWIDPYFKSLGIGFLRSDNLRYELKAEQAIGRKIRYILAFRREEDNLLKLYNYKNVLYSISNSLNIKPARKWNIRLIYTPLFRTMRTEDATRKDVNHIATGIISWLPKTKKVTAQFNALYSRYILDGDSVNINFENISYSQQLLFKSGFKTDLNVSWFNNNLTDTIGNNTYLGLLEFGYATPKGHSISLGGKVAYRYNTEPQYGFLAKAKIHVYKGLSAEAEMEKVIIGDYYSTFDISRIKKFPYYCKAQLSFNF